ncbi:amidohydrolase family protein [Paraglaciecola sp. 25GB23A]|uniref:amidohydrolase family protein n=1 Tax=Paraglaciecola sp. 25GB23A TaxID=3156068 RepID=UPI0032AFF2D1
MRKLICGALFVLLFACSEPTIEAPNSSMEQSLSSFTVMLNGNKVGYLKVNQQGKDTQVDYDYKSNGRGPAYQESLTLDSQGIPTHWKISGNTTFGNLITEQMDITAGQATWLDATGNGQASLDKSALYVPQNSSPYSAFVLATALLQTENLTMPALPAGQLSLKKLEELNIESANVTLSLSSYALAGVDLDPEYFILDAQQQLFAYITPRFIIIRQGFENNEAELRALSAKYSTERFEAIQAKYTHRYDGAVRIRNVRIFEPQKLSLSEPVSVVVKDGRIDHIALISEATQDYETDIDGAGGTLVPGLYDMHSHTGDDDSLMNVLAGITSVRDMGNSLGVLNELKEKIDTGILAGPRITRYGMIEGKSPSNNNNGILVENQEQALAAVNTYAENHFSGIKIYNSMQGQWVPAIAQRAKELGMRVSGHVPAFSNADQMILAGYDELTHINQIMLGWVLEPDEDTRTLLRLTALDRLPALDLESAPVQHTLKLMVDNHVAHDPTLAIHEYLLLSRNGETRAGVKDYIEHMPPAVQRSAKVSMAKITSPEQDQAYRMAYQKIVTTLKMMKERGILIVPGTDLGGAFNLHRELELYQELGYSPAELLKLGSYDMANYLGYTDRGSIEAGNLADFFLVPGNPVEDFKAIKTISLVSRGGIFYYPSEVYPEFGITPFTDKPKVQEADPR